MTPKLIPIAAAPGHSGKTLVVVMPALNEQETVAGVINAIPAEIAGINRIHVLVIDDGSTDETRRVAIAAGAHVVSHPCSRGLANTFRTAMREALRLGADVMVHLDSDGQHDPAAIPQLVAPVMAGRADLVVGVRPLRDATDMTPVRRYGNRIGSAVFRRLLRLDVADFTSGYRAFNREALLQLNTTSDCTHTLETLVQASSKRLVVGQVTVPIRSRAYGESRMTRSVLSYIRRSAGQALRSMLHHSPLALFGSASLGMFTIGGLVTTYFLYAYNQDGGLHLPALLGAILSTVVAIGLFTAGLIADGINANRLLIEEALFRLKTLEADVLHVADGRESATTQRHVA
jgi:glycosyltransferase involved in cell wall biosynthesis